MAISELCERYNKKLTELKKCSEEVFQLLDKLESNAVNVVERPDLEKKLKAAIDKYNKVRKEFITICEEFTEAIREAANH